jgi:hypothetical protein
MISFNFWLSSDSVNGRVACGWCCRVVTIIPVKRVSRSLIRALTTRSGEVEVRETHKSAKRSSSRSSGSVIVAGGIAKAEISEESPQCEIEDCRARTGKVLQKVAARS